MGDSIASLIYLSILVLAIAGWFVGANRPSLGKTVQIALVWGLIFMGLIAVYGLWNDISGNFNSRQATVSDQEIRVPRSPDGHYYLTLDINEVPIEFLVDTGATDLVLTQEDARKVGIDIENLAFLGQALTANGTVKIARTRLDKIELGGFVDHRFLASVNGGQMNGSLLGMSYLGRYDRIEITGDALILHR